MKELPKIISTKDLSYIEDSLNWNHTIIKLYMHFQESVCDEEICEFIEESIKMHEKHYNKLLKILD